MYHGTIDRALAGGPGGGNEHPLSANGFAEMCRQGCLHLVLRSICFFASFPCVPSLSILNQREPPLFPRTHRTAITAF